MLALEATAEEIKELRVSIDWLRDLVESSPERRELKLRMHYAGLIAQANLTRGVWETDTAVRFINEASDGKVELYVLEQLAEGLSG
jgi:hypothetical protein